MLSKNHVVRRFCASLNEEMRAVMRVMNKGHGVLKSRCGGEGIHPFHEGLPWAVCAWGKK